MQDSREIPTIEITRPDGGPLPENHHLEYRPEKRTWRMKVTVNKDGGRFVGERVVIPLHTSDPERAKQMRDVVLIALKKAGVLSRSVITAGPDDMPGGDDSPPCE